MARYGRRVYITARVLFAIVVYFVLRAQVWAAPPAGRIDTITPATAPIGARVTITGTGFGGANDADDGSRGDRDDREPPLDDRRTDDDRNRKDHDDVTSVAVGGVSATIVSARGNRIVFVVPAGVRPGATTVTVFRQGRLLATIGFTVQDRPPAAVIAPIGPAHVTDVVPLDGSASSDPDGDRLTYQWAIVTKPAGSLATPLNPAAAVTTFVVDLPGSYVAKLTVSDGLLSASATVPITGLPPLNPCLTNNGGCSANASCTNNSGVAACSCASGYSGDGKTCTAINSCLTNNGGCAPNATCTSTGPATNTCACPAGYSGDGRTCTPIDSCQTNNGGCATNVTCTSTGPGTNTCGPCPAGYTGDGKTCTDINECLVNNGGCSTNPMVTCINTPGSHFCAACPSGYTGDGVTCTAIDSCQTNNGGCSALATCTSTGPGTNSCACFPGYAGDGTTCTDINECLVNNGGCSIFGVCVNVPGSRVCACEPGYTGDGLTCTPIDSCQTNNGGCDANATCSSTGPGTNSCSCNAGYTGTGQTCTDINECATNNGGCPSNLVCVNTPGSFVCQLPFTPSAPLAAVAGQTWGTKGVAVADLNGDGKPDVVAVNSSPGAPSSVSVFLNRTTSPENPLTFDPQVVFPTGVESVDVTLTDVNADGKPDIVVANFGAGGTGTVSVLINTTPDASSPISFATAVSVDSPGATGALSIAAGKINGGSVQHFVTTASASNAITLYTNSGNGSAFTPTTVPSGGTEPVGLALGDLFGDGGLEIVVANAGDGTTSGNVTVFRNVPIFGNFTLATLGTFPAGVGARTPVIADFNHDGKKDIAVTNQGSQTVSVLLNTSTSSALLAFAPPVDFAVPDIPNGLSAPDVDNDGMPDLLVAIGTNNSTANAFVQLRNTTAANATTPSFVLWNQVADGVYPWAIAGVDLNGDGQPDTVVTNFTSNTVATFRNDTLPRLCATNNGGCDPLTTCTDTPGSRTCGACPAGYSGTGATVCSPINSCLTNNGGCDPLSVCTSTGPGANTCGDCPAGYTGSGATRCVDVDECTVNNGGCTNLCFNTTGSFQCVDTCPTGFSASTTPGECTQIDYCGTNNGGCDPLTRCTNSPAGPSCGACPVCATGTGATGCTLHNPCATNNGGCAVGVICTNLGNCQRSCGPCPTGTTGNGFVCVQVNACNKTPNGGCDPLTKCIPQGTTGRICGACPAGYQGNGLTGCVPSDQCVANNGGCPVDCLSVGLVPQCVSSCPAGYAANSTGECLSIDQCATNNGGCAAPDYCYSPATATVTSAGRTFQCVASCPAGYAPNATGECLAIDQCAATKPPCPTGTFCVNVGLPVTTNGSFFQCLSACPAGYTANSTGECIANGSGGL